MVSSRVVTAAGSLALASLANAGWVVTNLHPSGHAGSVGLGIGGPGGTQQVGYSYRATPSTSQATIWSGSALSALNVHPGDMRSSSLSATDGTRQVGSFDSAATGSARNHAAMWSGSAASMIDLHPTVDGLGKPTNYEASHAEGIAGGRQVGFVSVPAGTTLAALWTGTAASMVNLNPAGATGSWARDTDGTTHVGTAMFGSMRAGLWTSDSASSWVSLHDVTTMGTVASTALGVDGSQQVGTVGTHAALWSGTAASWVDLNPAGFHSSRAEDVHGGAQVGWARASAGEMGHAAIWFGSAGSMVDLHTLLPSGFVSSGAFGVWRQGDTIRVIGAASTGSGGPQAMMWEFTDGTIPLPTAAGMSLAGLGLLAARRRRA